MNRAMYLVANLLLLSGILYTFVVQCYVKRITHAARIRHNTGRRDIQIQSRHGVRDVIE